MNRSAIFPGARIENKIVAVVKFVHKAGSGRPLETVAVIRTMGGETIEIPVTFD